MKKLTIIGGGSVRAPLFAHSLARRAASLHISTLCLYDTDPEKLRLIGGIARTAAAQVSPALQVVLETDAERAIAGSDYIVTTIRVGGDHTRVLDEEIAAKYGILGQETTGLGGFAMAARSIPVLADYCRMIGRLAPQAWIFNFTNPSGMVTQALRDLGFARVIGICDTPSSTKQRLAQAMDYDNDRFTLEFFGLNHLSWARRAVYNGRDVLPEILRRGDLPARVPELALFDTELLRMLGCIPNEYLYYYYYRDRAIENIRRAGTTRGLLVERNNLRLLEELRAAPANDTACALQIYLRHMHLREASYMQIETGRAAAAEPTHFSMPEGEGYAGIAMDFIAAAEQNRPREIVLSVPCRGSLQGMADDDIVEITCTVGPDGPTPVQIGAVPPEQYALIRAVKAYERLGVQAILQGSASLAVRALMAHPLIGSYPLAAALIDELRRVQPEYAGCLAPAPAL